MGLSNEGLWSVEGGEGRGEEEGEGWQDLGTMGLEDRAG